MSTGSVEKSLRTRIISGSVVLLSGSTLSVVINLAYNVSVAHFLGPKGFGNANALYTILTLISAITLSFQIITAKIIAQQGETSSRDTAYRTLHRGSWVCGLLVALLLLAFQSQITTYLDLPGKTLVMILAVGAAFYVPLGSRRGYIQGAYGFRKLAANLVLEGVMRLLGSLFMISFGFDVEGVIVANSVAMAVAYFAIAPKLDLTAINPLTLRTAFQEVSHATVFFTGQVLINNSDIVLVKHFLPAREAGLYAAIAMVGRVIFSGSQAIVNSMFPVVAGSNAEERKNLSLIGTALLSVLAVGAAVTVGLAITPDWLWTTLFGSEFKILGPHGFPYLLALYAATTVVYCLSVVVMTYEMSYKIANTAWFQLLFSGVLIAGISKYHESLQQVIMVQLVLLACFLILVAVPFFLDMLNTAGFLLERRKLRLMRRLSEDEVISGFLRSELGKGVYSEYEERMRSIFLNPDLQDVSECAVRRALLELRHRALWRELPEDTQWYEVEIGVAELNQIRVFPRAQWARTARGNFAIKTVAERIKDRRPTPEDAFACKISEIRGALTADTLDSGPIILIGLTESDPLTILDGNHRFVAGVLENKVERLKFVCGLSTSMAQCCWYKTSIFNLLRYGRNLLRAFLEIRNREVLQLCESPGTLPDEVPPPPVL